MNDTMERQNSTATRSDYFGYDAGQYENRRESVRQPAPDYTRDFGYYQPQRQSAPDYTRGDGYYDNGGYNGYGGYNNSAYNAYDNAGYAPETAEREAYRASYDNRYNYEDPRHYEQQDLVPVQEGGFPEYGINKNGGKPKKKMRLNTKAKILIALYFAIIAVVATLILVNVVIGGSAAEATTEPSAYTQDATAYFVGADGSASALQAGEGASYAYDTQTNSFDEFCDWLGEQVG